MVEIVQVTMFANQAEILLSLQESSLKIKQIREDRKDLLNRKIPLLACKRGIVLIV